MTRKLVFLVVLLAVALAVPSLASAQKPNLSGKWIQDMEKSDQPQGGGGGGRGPAGPQEITITQTAADLTIERTAGQNVVKMVYKLDGSPSTNTMQGRGGATEQVSKTVWDGNNIVTKYSQTMGENTVEVTVTYSLNADGTLKQVTARGTNPPRTVVFKKG